MRCVGRVVDFFLATAVRARDARRIVPVFGTLDLKIRKFFRRTGASSALLWYASRYVVDTSSMARRRTEQAEACAFAGAT